MPVGAQRLEELARAGQREAERRLLLVFLEVQRVGLLGELRIEHELGQELIGALADLPMDGGARNHQPHGMKGARPGIDVQVVGIDERAVDVEEDDHAEVLGALDPPSSRR